MKQGIVALCFKAEESANGGDADHFVGTQKSEHDNTKHQPCRVPGKKQAETDVTS